MTQITERPDLLEGINVYYYYDVAVGRTDGVERWRRTCPDATGTTADSSDPKTRNPADTHMERSSVGIVAPNTVICECLKPVIA
jgi:hypothetical protein